MSDYIADGIEAIPAADVEPVRRGNWHIRFADEMTLCLECSVCGRKVDNIDLHHLLEAGEYGEACRRYPYCHCGAKMCLEVNMTREEAIKHAEAVMDCTADMADLLEKQQNKIRDLKYDAQEREKAVVQLRKKWQDAEMFICTMCGHFDHSTDGNIVYGNKECCEIVGYPYCKKFTPWISASVRLPKELEPVNVVWVNHNPAPYYRYMKDVPQKAIAVYYRGAWYWWSCVCEDLLVECGANETDQVDDDIEITHWQPLPELPKEE